MLTRSLSHLAEHGHAATGLLNREGPAARFENPSLFPRNLIERLPENLRKAQDKK